MAQNACQPSFWPPVLDQLLGMSNTDAIRQLVSKLIEKEDDIREGDRLVLARALLGCIQTGHASFESYQRYCVYQELIWEKLNTGHWREVWPGWRKLYAACALLRIHSSLSLLKQCTFSIYSEDLDERSLLESIIRLADQGLLLGGPIMNNSLETVAQLLTEYLAKEDNDNQPPSKLMRLEVEQQKVEVNLDTVAPKLPSSCPPLQPLKRINQPDIVEFMSMCKLPLHPAVLTGCISDWPAMTARRWSVERLLRLAGPRTVPVEMGANYSHANWTQKLLTVSEFVKRFMCENPTQVGYLAQHQLLDQVPSLREDIEIPDYCYSGEDEEEVDINVWIGPAGTVSPLHTDPKHNLLTQVVGTKYVVLYPSDCTEYLYPHPTPMLANTSRLDLDAGPEVIEKEFPEFQKANGFHTILHPGEMLYIPPRMWHYVRSLSTSFSVSFWWQ